MHTLTVAYGHPKDPAAFDAYYENNHRPLADGVPGLQGFSLRRCTALDESQPPFYCIAALDFDSAEGLQQALASPAGQAAAADIANFADGGAQIFVQYDR